jgi:hypothetical protein
MLGLPAAASSPAVGPKSSSQSSSGRLAADPEYLGFGPWGQCCCPKKTSGFTKRVYVPAAPLRVILPPSRIGGTGVQSLPFLKSRRRPRLKFLRLTSRFTSRAKGQRAGWRNLHSLNLGDLQLVQLPVLTTAAGAEPATVRSLRTAWGWR